MSFLIVHHFSTGRWRQTGNSIESLIIWLSFRQRQMVLSHIFTHCFFFFTTKTFENHGKLWIFFFLICWNNRTAEMVVSGDGNYASSSNGQCLLHVRSRLQHQQQSQLSPQQSSTNGSTTSNNSSSLIKKTLPVRPGDDVVKRTRSMNV